MNNTPASESPGVVTSKGIGSTALLGSVFFRSACSGLWYENPGAAGAIDAVQKDGKIYHIEPKEVDSFRMDGKENLQTFGGEAWIDGYDFSDYGIDFEKVSVHGLTPDQMATLACKMVDHLLINGHSFELRRTHEQDQHTRLVRLLPNVADEPRAPITK
jgi:hypothetical protein